MGGTSFECTVGIGNSAAGVIVEMSFDITRDNTPKCANEIVDLSGRSAANGIGNTLMVSCESSLFGGRHVLTCEAYHTINADLVDSAVDAQKVDKLGPKRVLA